MNVNSVRINIGDILYVNAIKYRVLRVTDKTCDAVELDTNKLIGISIPVEKLECEDIRIEEVNIEYKESEVNSLVYSRRASIINSILNLYHGDIMEFVFNHNSRKNLLIRNFHGVSNTTFYKIVRIFAQSGCDYSVLNQLPCIRDYCYSKGKVRGCKRKDGSDPYMLKSRDFRNISYSIEEYVKKEGMSVPKAYDKMINTFYLKNKNNRIPSIYQFRDRIK